MSQHNTAGSANAVTRVNNYWHSHNDTDTVLIFLHGIFSDSNTCWRADNGTFWPDLVQEDGRLGNPSIYLAGFHTAVDAGALNVSSCAREVMDALERPDSDGPPAALIHPRLVFVCHSTGGIVARYLIERNHYRFHSKAVGLALIASPALGSKWADIGSFLARYHGNELALQLRSGDRSVDDINDRFKELVDERARRMPGLFGMEACETEFIWRQRMPGLLRYLVPNRWRIVGKQSAGQFFGPVKELRSTNHFTAVKPTDPNHPAHEFLVTFLGRFRGIPTPLQRGYESHNRAVGNTATAEATHQAVTGADWSRSSPPQVAVNPNVVNLAQSPTEVAAASQRPQLGEIFEMITDPGELNSALYATEAARGIAPYDCPYINSREDLANVQEALEIALRQANGRLMICGHKGIGKTREAVELARNRCTAKWTILVARTDGTHRLAAPQSLPAKLADAKVLVIVDNLHTKIAGTADVQGPPYLERLQAFVEWLERQVPGNVHVLVTASDERHFARHVNVGNESASWRGFGVFRLPMLTSDGLRRLAQTLAELARVRIAVEDIGKLIDNSDRKPETVFINVDLARQLSQPLSMQTWRPSGGESWKERFESSRANHPGTQEIFAALRLLIQFGLPARLPYVVSLAGRMGAANPAAAIAALVNDGLLGQRRGILAAFSTEQLEELVGNAGAGSVLSEFRETIESEILASKPTNPAWGEDLQALSLALVRALDPDAAAEIAARAAHLAPDEAWPYKLQAAVRFMRLDLDGTLSCLSKAIDLVPKDTDVLFLRGATRNLQAEFAAALEDLKRAIELGRDDAPVHIQVGVAYYQTQQWKEADAALSAAFERGETSAGLLFTRGITRMQMNDLAGAEDDLSGSIDQRFDFSAMEHEFQKLLMKGPTEKTAALVSNGSSVLHAIRAFVRFKRGNFAGADEDLSSALALGADQSYEALLEQVRNSPLPMIKQAQVQMKQGALGAGLLHYLRAVSRLQCGKLQEAMVDFEEAIAGGLNEGELYLERGWAFLQLEQHEKALSDALTALERGKRDVRSHSLAGLACLALKKFPEAESQFDEALGLKPQDANLLVWRGLARMNQQKLLESEIDFTTAFALDPKPQTVYLSACVRFDLQKFAEAEADFTVSEQLGHVPTLLFVLRGAARLTQGKVAEANDDVEAAFARGATDILAYSARGSVRQNQERFSEAEADFTTAIGLGRNDAWIFAQRGEVRYRLNQFEDAERDCDALVRLGVVEADVFMRRGTARSKQGKADSAAEDYRAAIAAGRDDGYVYFCLARESASLMRVREAEVAYQKALERDANPHFRALRGGMRVVIGAFGPAEDDIDAVIQQLPPDPNLRSLRALARLGSGKLRAALEDIEACILMSPQNADFLTGRALIRIRLGDLRNAEKDCVLLGSMTPEKEARGCRGALHLARGNFAAALPDLEAAAQQDNEWRYWLALANLLTGRTKDAQRIYADAMAQTRHPGDGLLHADNLAFYLKRHQKKLSVAIRDAGVLIGTELRKPAAEALAAMSV